MWDDDQRLRAAVLAELAEDAPPPSGGGLPEVVRLGRRRRRARYAGPALAVAALLTATGAAAVTLNGDPLPPAAPPVTSALPDEAPWPKADLQGQIPYSTFAPSDTSGSAPPDGRAVLPYPLCEFPEYLHERRSVYPADEGQLAAFAQAVRAAAPAARVAIPVERHLGSTRPGGHDVYSYSADIADSGGTGSITLEAGDFTGTPLEAADAQAFEEANCAPPKRHVLDDGTVLQVYEVRPSEPYQSLTRALRIFRPDGRMLTVTVANWGSPDFAPNPTQPEIPVRVGPGRPTLPLTEGQLAEVGLAIAR